MRFVSSTVSKQHFQLVQLHKFANSKGTFNFDSKGIAGLVKVMTDLLLLVLDFVLVTFTSQFAGIIYLP